MFPIAPAHGKIPMGAHGYWVFCTFSSVKRGAPSVVRGRAPDQGVRAPEEFAQLKKAQMAVKDGCLSIFQLFYKNIFPLFIRLSQMVVLII